MTKKAVEHIPERKINAVKEISDLIKNNRTILVASIKNLPASQFQEIGKKLRGKAIIKVPKKSIMFRSIDNSHNEELKELKEHIKDSSAILFSNMDCFDLALELLKSKSPAKAKAGQEAPEDIEIPEGPTDLVPGPAISELGSLGIQIQIEKGKIHIKEPKVIVKKGGKISESAADIMSKLDIKPFSVGFIPLLAFDTKEGKLYLDIKIDKEGAVEELKKAFERALPFAVEIGYVSKDTIKFLISKAGMHGKAISVITENAGPKQDEVKGENEKESGEKEDISEKNKENENHQDQKIKSDEENK